MDSGSSKLWVGLGVGTILGGVVYHCTCSAKLREMMCHAFHKMRHGAERWADKVAEDTCHVAEKVEEVKDKVHSFADNMKK